MKLKTSKKSPEKTDKKLSLFDHVNQIKHTKDKNYYNKLSDDDKRSFNHFMILRALSMNERIVEDVADLYKYINLIPPAQFYQLLITIIPKDQYFHKWIKSKAFKHSPELTSIVTKYFNISTKQANEYLNILIKTDDGQKEIINICQYSGYTDAEIEKIFDATADKEYLNQPKE